MSDNIIKDFHDQHSGPSNAFRHAMLPGDTTEGQAAMFLGRPVILTAEGVKPVGELKFGSRQIRIPLSVKRKPDGVFEIRESQPPKFDSWGFYRTEGKE